MELYNLILMSGADVPFPQASINIHQPTIKEISLIQQSMFFAGCQVFQFDKENLSSQDKVNLENYTNFDIIMSIMKEKNAAIRSSTIGAIRVLTLLFPDYNIRFGEKEIFLEKEQESHVLNNDNLKAFQNIIAQIFCTKKESQAYEPMGQSAKRIADKIKKGKQKKAALQKKADQKVTIFGRYVSILAVGESKNIPDLMGYTVFQLFDEYNRYILKQSYDLYIQQKLAGAKDVKQVDNWMKDLYKEESSQDDFT